MNESRKNSAVKILHIIASVDPKHGGPIEGIKQQCDYLASSHHTREILSLDLETDAFLSEYEIEIHPMGDERPARSPRSLLPWRRYGYSRKFVPWLRAHAADYDAIVVNGLWNYAAWGAWLALRNGATPYFVFTHGMLDPWFRTVNPFKHLAKQMLWLVSEGRLLRDATAVLFTCEEERVSARGVFWGYSYVERVVAYGVGDVGGDCETQRRAFREAVPTLGSRRFLLFLSRIHPKKGCDLLVRAFARIAEHHPDLDLVIAGPDEVGLANKLQDLATRLGVGERIHWPGMLRGDVKWGAFRAAEAFVLPSHQENFGIVVAEAMACSTPVLITDKVNIWREVEACGGGLVSEDSEAGVADLLSCFLSLDSTALAAMRVAARQGYLDKFGIERCAEDVLQAVREAVELA